MNTAAKWRLFTLSFLVALSPRPPRSNRTSNQHVGASSQPIAAGGVVSHELARRGALHVKETKGTQFRERSEDLPSLLNLPDGAVECCYESGTFSYEE